jgi:hemerythrin superfamily protein
MARTVDRTPAVTDAMPAMTKARAAASPGDWLSLALLHHDQIRGAFQRASLAPPDGSRLLALKALGVLLTGHSIAEEAVLYPVLVSIVAKRGADALYTEQSLAKVEMAALERINPADDAWLEKLGEIRAAVEEHMLEEEQKWFLEIKASGANQAKLTTRYKEEFERYTRTGAIGSNGAWDGPPRPVGD